MKKAISLAAAALAAASACAELKIGTVEMMTLVRNHASYETNKKLLQDAERDYQKTLDKMKSDIDAIQDEGKKAADQAKNPMLSQAAKEKIEKDLLEIQNRFVGAQQKLRSEAMESQQKLQEFESRLLKITTDDIRRRVGAFAEKNGYDLIVESTVTAFAKKSLSVTDDILREMGVDPAKARGKEKSDEGK
jgi:Skp family chaperone for outer membrane proteins